MASPDVITIGASSGGIEALQRVISGLPSALSAAVFVVVHVQAGRESQLPAILNRAGGLPAAHAVDCEPIRRGRIYVAPPAFQTYIQQGRLSVRRGPAENLHRPSIDALFRTAAHYYGPRVIGVILSGALDDGATGLATIKKAGGIAIVQEPSDAIVPDMPLSALHRAQADHCVAAENIGALLARLVKGEGVARTALQAEVALETVEESGRPEEASASNELGRPSEFVCPDCSGTLYEIIDSDRVRFRCRVGHACSEDALIVAQNDSVERALWIALRALEERAALLQKLAERSRERGRSVAATVFEQKSQQVDEDVKAVHALITGRMLDPVEPHSVEP